jgi:hypothetical protein
MQKIELNLMITICKKAGNMYFSIFLSGCKRFKSLHKNFRSKDNTFIKQNNYYLCSYYRFIYILNKKLSKMKKTYLFGLLFTLTLTGVLVAKNPGHEVRWLQTMAGNSKIDPSSPEIQQSIEKLKELRTTRIMFLQNPDRITAIRMLKELNRQEKELINKLNNRPTSYQTAVSKIKATPQETRPLRHSMKERPAPMKVSSTGVIKHLLDSFVMAEKHENLWKKQYKMAFSYNGRGHVTETMSFDADSLQAWHGNEKSFFTYDDSGRLTGHELHIWDNELSKWFVMMKMNVTFNAQGEMSSYEMYQDEYNQEKQAYELAGMEKMVMGYDANGVINQITYYMWDYTSSTWQQHMLMQMKVEGGIELMFASYVWNVEKNMWIGEGKFEYEPIPEFGMMKSTNYRWNEITNEWIVYSKEEIAVGQDAFGVHFTATYYETDEETMVLHPSMKYKYSKPFGNDYLNEDNYGLKEVWAWDNLNTSWMNQEKEENTFDTYGNVTNKTKYEWLSNSTTSVYEWILKFRAVNTINDIHKIGSTEETHYYFNSTSQNYDLVMKKQFDYTYTLVGETYLMNQKSARELGIDATEWKNTERYQVTYFDYKEIKTEVNSNWDSGTSGWVPWRRNEYDYNHDMSLSLTQTETWNPINSSWQLQYRSENKRDEYERLLKSSYAYWSDALGKVFLQNYQEYTYFGGMEDPRLLLEIEVVSQMNYDGVNFFAHSYGYKNEWIYEEIGQIKRLKQSNEYVFKEIDGILPVFNQTYKTDLNYDLTHPEALTEEIQSEYDSGLGQWVNDHKGVVTYDFSIARNMMIVPFEEYDRESYIFFSFKPNGYMGYSWNKTTGQWEESDRNLIFFSQAEISSVKSTNTNGYRIYPNPVKDLLMIESDGQIEQGKMSIYNIEGKLVSEQLIQGKAIIDVSIWKPGIYFYQITNAEMNIRGKFVRE